MNPMARVRGLSEEWSQTLEEARARSTIVAGLIDQLESSDVVVFITRVNPKLVPTAELAWIGSGHGVRFVQIRVGAAQISRNATIEWLAHELQHAVEVASSKDVRDLDSFEMLFQHIGREWKTGRYETWAAVRVQEAVKDELRDGRKRERAGTATAGAPTRARLP